MKYFTDLWLSFGCISVERIRQLGHRPVKCPNRWAMGGGTKPTEARARWASTLPGMSGTRTCTLKGQRERGKDDSNVNLV